MSSMPELNILIALTCEAQPLVGYFKMKKVASKPFAHYQSTRDDLSINLVVSGSGQINMAAATAWCASQNDVTPAWLNIGTSGHIDKETGVINLVHSVENESARRIYPPLIARWTYDTISLKTVSEPCVDYPSELAVDMEAYAFFAVAQKFSSAELVQSLKVISDNSSTGIANLNARTISELISKNLVAIDNYTKNFIKILPSEAALQTDLKEIEYLHCTVSQQHQFVELMRRFNALHLTKPNDLSGYKSMPDLLNHLSMVVQQTAPEISHG